jgi:hypothetical protein
MPGICEDDGFTPIRTGVQDGPVQLGPGVLHCPNECGWWGVWGPEEIRASGDAWLAHWPTCPKAVTT